MNNIDKYKSLTEKIISLNYAEAIISWDAQTEAPRSSQEIRGNTLGYLTELKHQLLINKDTKEILDSLNNEKDKQSNIERKMITKTTKDYERFSKIPTNELIVYKKLLSKAQHSWEEAREKKDFSLFCGDLEIIIETLKKFAAYRNPDIHPYNVYLDDYEDGMTMEYLEKFFAALKKRIVPLIKGINDSKVNIRRDFLSRDFDTNVQKKLSIDLLKKIGFDLDRGVFKESTHPFTSGTNRNDVRLTSRYDKNDFMSGILSTAHEGGHALYEQNIGEDLDNTLLSGGTSLGIHESQSRIYENNFFKSHSFLSYYYPTILQHFPEQLSDVTLDEFYKAANIVESSFIRVDADELTYPLHIMIRYEIEVALIEGSVNVKDLPILWNKKMEEYLGITPKNDSLGVLQDVHWSFGLFGYFPTYALGSAYAAQFAHYISKDMDIDKILLEGKMDKPLNWLKDKIHKHGGLLSPEEVCLNATGEKLNPEYFLTYLENKFSKIYNLEV